MSGLRAESDRGVNPLATFVVATGFMPGFGPCRDCGVKGLLRLRRITPAQDPLASDSTTPRARQPTPVGSGVSVRGGRRS